MIKNLKVAGSLGKPMWIKLSRAYKQELPTDEQEITTPENLKRRNYIKLSPHSDVLTTTHSGVVDIKLLEKRSIKIMKMLLQKEFIKKLRIYKTTHKQNPGINHVNTVTKASPINGADLLLYDNGVHRVGG